MIPHRNNLEQAIRVRPQDLVKGSIRLLSPPEIFLKVSRMVEDPKCSGAALAQTIARDPVLTAQLLRVANSPFYGFPSRIGTIERAVTVIGTRALRDLVLAASAVGIFTKMPLVDMRPFWHHSLLSGLASRLLGLRCGVPEPEALFVAGLLHDVGQLIILAKLPEMGRETRIRARDCRLPLHTLERAVFGFDHAEVGGELLRQWHLPQAVWEPVSCHHRPVAAAREPLAAAIIHLADILAHDLPDAATPEAIGLLLAAIVDQVAAPVLEVLQIDAETLTALRLELLHQVDSLEEILLNAA